MNSSLALTGSALMPGAAQIHDLLQKVGYMFTANANIDIHYAAIKTIKAQNNVIRAELFNTAVQYLTPHEPLARTVTPFAALAFAPAPAPALEPAAILPATLAAAPAAATLAAAPALTAAPAAAPAPATLAAALTAAPAAAPAATLAAATLAAAPLVATLVTQNSTAKRSHDDLYNTSDENMFEPTTPKKVKKNALALPSPPKAKKNNPPPLVLARSPSPSPSPAPLKHKIKVKQIAAVLLSPTRESPSCPDSPAQKKLLQKEKRRLRTQKDRAKKIADAAAAALLADTPAPQPAPATLPRTKLTVKPLTASLPRPRKSAQPTKVLPQAPAPAPLDSDEEDGFVKPQFSIPFTVPVTDTLKLDASIQDEQLFL